MWCVHFSGINDTSPINGGCMGVRNYIQGQCKEFLIFQQLNLKYKDVHINYHLFHP